MVVRAAERIEPTAVFVLISLSIAVILVSAGLAALWQVDTGSGARALAREAYAEVNKRAAKLLLLGTFVLFAFITWFVSPVFAHEFWINEGRYVGSDNVHCCGPKDCFPIEETDVTTTPEGYVLKTYNNETVPFHLATPAQPDPDGKTRFWRCQKPDGARRCFFAPYGGS